MSIPIRLARIPAALGAVVLATALVGGIATPASALPGSTSPDGLWTELDAAGPAAAPAAPDIPRSYRLDRDALEALISLAPMENTPGAGAEVLLSIPMPDGTFARFAIEESPVMEPELAAQFPDVRTYRGRGVDDPSLTTRFDRTPLGFHAVVLAPEGAVIVKPLGFGGTADYVSGRTGRDSVAFECGVDDLGSAPVEALAALPTGDTLRTYRLAVAATGEYTAFFGSAANALAGIVTTVNMVTAVYEVELAVRVVLVAGNMAIIFTDPDTDPFPLSNKNSETQAAIDAGIGDANYDVGHLFHREGSSISGNAGCIACVCASGSKGSGWSQGPDPTDGNYLFVVCHEMGHQFGGTHTFNGTGCNAGQYTGSSAWEPGSGTTIMSYSSICGADNTLGGPVGDLYFHAGNREQITLNTQVGGGACGATSGTGNTPPSANAGSNYTIPRGTPFRLTAGGADADGDPLTFTWEQLDLGPTAPLSAVDDGEIPLFRSFPPSSNPVRTLPAFADLLAGPTNLFPNKLGEQLPSTDRILTFRTTVRDNQGGGGGAADDEMVVTVSGSPFAVTWPNGGESVPAGASSTVTWTVGGGSVALLVNILYSDDGGANFSTLAAGVANDGSQSVTFPCGTTSQGRVLIEAVGNIFFDISDDDFSVAPVPPAITVNATGGSVDASCEYTVTFSGTVNDDGAVAAGDVDVSVSLLTANATLGAPTVNKIQVDGNTVTVSGSVLVSDLTGSPATVRVRIEAEDACGAGASEETTADVSDTTPPDITCPDPIVVECTEHGGTPADDPQLVPFFTGVSATDNCDPDPGIVNDAPAFFPAGQTTDVIFTATDASGNATPCTTSVTVVDTTPPEISVELNRDALWPPNHKMSEIVAAVEVTDICDPNPTWVLTSIVSDEPDNGLGDGDTENDIQEADFGFEDATFLLRSERAGGGDGRCYTITFTASDIWGNTADSVLCVRVPHDKSGSATPSAGYLPTGAWVDTGAPTFSLVLMSDPGFDPAGVDTRRVYVGNSQSVMRPSRTRLIDLTGDGVGDLVLQYPTAGAQALRALASKKDAIGLHYRGADGTDYLVRDIFDIGAPVSFDALLVDAGLGEVEDLGAVDAGDGIEVGATHPGLDVVAPGGAPRAGILSVPVAGNVRIEVFDVRGRRMRVLLDGYLDAGDHVLSWDGRGDGGRPAPSGVYFYRIQGPGMLESRRVVWVR